MRRTWMGLLVAALLGSGGCSHAPGFIANSFGLPVQEKAVMSKLPPNELIAVDGTRCTVTRGRFDKVELSETVACFWTADRDHAVP